MSERWVLNASPLIVLARAGFEDLLLKLPEQVVVPKAVETEIQAGLRCRGNAFAYGGWLEIGRDSRSRGSETNCG
jgi:predicted nucleic acid-binding protein